MSASLNKLFIISLVVFSMQVSQAATSFEEAFHELVWQAEKLEGPGQFYLEHFKTTNLTKNLNLTDESVTSLKGYLLDDEGLKDVSIEYSKTKDHKKVMAQVPSEQFATKKAKLITLDKSFSPEKVPQILENYSNLLLKVKSIRFLEFKKHDELKGEDGLAKTGFKINFRRKVLKFFPSLFEENLFIDDANQNYFLRKKY